MIVLRNTFLAFLFFLLPFSVSLLGWNWATVEVDAPMFSGTFDCGIAAGDDSVYVTYNTGTIGNDVIFKFGVWDIENATFTRIITMDSNGGSGIANDVTVDPTSEVHIVYSDAISAILYIRSWGNHGMWLGPEEVYAGAGFTAYLSFVALDSSNFPHVASHKGMSPSYFYSDGSNWYSNDDIQAHLNRAHGIVLDGSDHPYISGSHSGNAVVCYYDGSAWSQDIVDNTATCYTVSLARDGLGHLHVAYRYASGGNKLKYGYNNGSGWTTEILDSTGNVEPCIVVDRNNYPHISYRSNSDNCLKIASWNGSDWDIEVVDSIGDVGFYSALTMATVGGIDYPFIVYSDATTDNTRIKLAYDENSLGIETPSFVAESQSGCIRLTWRIAMQHDVARYLIQRKSSEEHGEYSQIHSIPGPGSSPSPQTYLYEDNEVQTGMRYFYKLGVVASNENTEWYGPVSAILLPGKPKMQVSPNPFSSSTAISLPGVSRYRSIGEPEINIYDLTGRLIKNLSIPNCTWYGWDETGKTVAPGTYFVKLKVGDYTETKKLIKVR